MAHFLPFSIKSALVRSLLGKRFENSFGPWMAQKKYISSAYLQKIYRSTTLYSQFFRQKHCSIPFSFNFFFLFRWNNNNQQRQHSKSFTSMKLSLSQNMLSKCKHWLFIRFLFIFWTEEFIRSFYRFMQIIVDRYSIFHPSFWIRIAWDRILSRRYSSMLINSLSFFSLLRIFDSIFMWE